MRTTKSSRKTLEQQHFSKQQLEMLKSKPWWIASTQTPYLIKFAIFDSAILMKCTNLTHLYVKRFNESEIKQDQQVYAKGLTIKDFKHLLEFFDGYLSERDPDAKYRFRESHEDRTIDFKFQKLIEIFPFVWKFKLHKVQCDITDLICNQIINPLAFSLERQSRRHQILKKKSQQMEKQYMKRMTETQKKMYRPVFVETEQDWKLMTKKQEGLYNLNAFNRQMLFPYVFDGFVAFAIKQYLRPFTCDKPKVPIQNLLQVRNNPQPAPIIVEKSPNSKSRLPQIYNDEEEEVKSKSKNSKDDNNKGKNNKKGGKNLSGIDFL